MQVGPTASCLGPSAEIAIMDHQHLQDSGMPQGEPGMDPMSAEVGTVVDNWVEIKGKKGLSLQLVLQICHLQCVFLRM